MVSFGTMCPYTNRASKLTNNELSGKSDSNGLGIQGYVRIGWTGLEWEFSLLFSFQLILDLFILHGLTK